MDWYCGLLLSTFMLSTKTVISSNLRANGFLVKGGYWLYEDYQTTCQVKLESVRYKHGKHYLSYYIKILPLFMWKFDGPLISGTMYSPSIDDKIELEACLNENLATVGGIPRLERLNYLMKTRVIPFLLELRTTDGIRRMHTEGFLRGAAVHAELLVYLRE
jgi:hypothetical protein